MQNNSYKSQQSMMNQNSMPNQQQTQYYDLAIQQNQQMIDWYKIQSIDLKSIKQTNDVDTLEAIIPSIINSNISQEEFENVKSKNIQKLVKLLQMSLQYFDFTNDYMENLEIETQNEIQNQEHLIQQNENFLKKSKKNISKMKDDIEIKQEVIKKYKHFLQKKAQYKCHICTNKYFENSDYLLQHMYKRHPQLMPVSAQHPNFTNFQNLIMTSHLEKEIQNKQFKNFEEISENQKEKEKIIFEKIISQNQEDNQIMLQNLENKMSQLEKLYNTQQQNKQNNDEDSNNILKNEINNMHQQLKNIFQKIPHTNQVDHTPQFQPQLPKNIIQKQQQVQQKAQKSQILIYQDKQQIQIQNLEKKQIYIQNSPVQTPNKTNSISQQIIKKSSDIEQMDYEQYSINNQSSQKIDEYEENQPQYIIDQRPEELMEEEKEFISLISNKYKQQYNQEDKQNILQKIDSQIYNQLYTLGLNIGDLNSLSESELQQMISKLKSNQNLQKNEQYSSSSYFGDRSKLQSIPLASQNSQKQQKLRAFKHEDTINSEIFDSNSGIKFPSGLGKQSKQQKDEDFDD